MRVSVIVCEHTLDRYEDLREAVLSLQRQTHGDTEIVLVSDGNDDVCSKLRADYGEATDIVVCCLDENRGLAGARNAGVRAATGEVVAFFDDDAIAAEDWVEQVVEAYQAHGVPAVGGRMVPEWVAGKPDYLPEEFYWLVGVTHRGFGPAGGDRLTPGEVRNTFGSNISFRREVFEALDGFDTDIAGRTGDMNLQSEEPEFCARLQDQHGYGVYYNPHAVVAHKVFEYRTRPRWLLDRAFWQGYSKRGMDVLLPETGDEESDFLGALLTDFVPQRLEELAADPSREKALQLLMLFVFTASVGLGYLYGIYKWRER